MNYLLVSDDKLFFEDTKTILNQIDSKANIFTSSITESKLKETTAELRKLSLCIIYSGDSAYHPIEEISLLSNLTGFLISENIPVLTNNTFLHQHTIFDCKQILHFQSSKDIYKYLKDNYESILAEDLKVNAKKTLFESGIPYTPDCFGTYIEKNKLVLCQLFINAGMDVNAKNENGTSLLNIAVRSDNFDMVKNLIELGADVNTVSSDRGYTPVMDAVWRGNEKITEYLIKQGADLNTISKEGQSNLVLAVGANKFNICKLLAENGADPDIKDQMGMSAYGYANLFKKQELIDILKPYHKE